MSTQKTEQPTLKKFQDARKAGQIVKSSEVTHGVQLFAIAIWFWFAGPKLLEAINETFRQALAAISLPFATALERVMLSCIDALVNPLGSLVLTLGVVTLLTELVQTGGLLFAPEKLKPKWDALNPANNAKNIFSLKKLYDLLEIVFKVTLLAVVFFYILHRYGKTLVYLPVCGVECAIPVIATLTAWLLGWLIGFYVVFATIDYLYERLQLIKQLKMSKEDIKQEFKDISGNPAMKKRVREMHGEMQQEGPAMPTRIARSTAVIRNPTHIAVCLYYKQGETPLPMVTEKGAGDRALYIIELATQSKVPIVSNITLARQLMLDTAIDDYIPEKLFEPVAEILRIVMVELDEEEV
jgi:type III secretion protein U